MYIFTVIYDSYVFFYFLIKNLVKNLFKLVRIDGNVNMKLTKTKIIFKLKLFYEFDAC